MLAKVSNDFSMPIRKDCCRSSSCVSACLCCVSANRHSVWSCRRSPTRPTIALHFCAWQKPSQHSLLACAALLKPLVSSNARESCDSWLKTFWSAKIPSSFVTAFRFLRVRPKTEDRSPQTVKITFCVRGVISPALSNCVLDGLERLLMEKFPTKKPLSSFGGKFPCVNLIRYADDFIITGRTKELLEGEIKPLVEQFLQARGLELSPAKTVITHVEKGFDFLGQNVRKYPNGKLLIKPSKKNVKIFLGGIRKIIKAALGMSAADLIDWLNPKIRGWVNYHRHVVSKRVFHRVDHVIFTSLWQWARRRHQKKSPCWLKQKYFERQGGNSWIFFGESCDNEGIPHTVRLLLASRTPIQRHVKVKGEAHPYNPACEPYFEKREGDHMSETFRGTRTLRFLWHEQSGLCAVCNERITRITGWRLHYCVPRVLGGSHSVENRTLLHLECHDRVHCQPLSVSKPRLPERGVRRA